MPTKTSNIAIQKKTPKTPDSTFPPTLTFLLQEGVQLSSSSSDGGVQLTGLVGGGGGPPAPAAEAKALGGCRSSFVGGSLSGVLESFLWF